MLAGSCMMQDCDLSTALVNILSDFTCDRTKSPWHAKLGKGWTKPQATPTSKFTLFENRKSGQQSNGLFGTNRKPRMGQEKEGNSKIRRTGIITSQDLSGTR